MTSYTKVLPRIGGPKMDGTIDTTPIIKLYRRWPRPKYQGKDLVGSFRAGRKREGGITEKSYRQGPKSRIESLRTHVAHVLFSAAL